MNSEQTNEVKRKKSYSILRAQNIKKLLSTREIPKPASMHDGTIVRAKLTQTELSREVYGDDNSLSRVLNGHVALTEKRARIIADVFNRGISEDDTARIRWEYVYGIDPFMTVGEYDAALNKASEGLRATIDGIFSSAMDTLDLYAWEENIEDMQTGQVFPYTAAQHDKMEQALRDYAAALLSHHVMTARKNQIELDAAESRGDAETAAIYRKKLEEDI